VMIVVRRLHS